MKKIAFITGMMMLAILALVACGGSGGSEQVQDGGGEQVTTTTAAPELATQPQQQVTEVTTAAEVPVTVGTSTGFPGFDEPVVLAVNAATVYPEYRGDLLEITFSSDITFVTAEFERERRMLVYEINYGDVFARIPVTIRNLYSQDFARVGRLSQLLQFGVDNPDGSSVASTLQSSIHDVMGENNLHAHQTLADGEVIETYIYLSYYGDGEYTLTFLVAAVSTSRLRFTLDIEK